MSIELFIVKFDIMQMTDSELTNEQGGRIIIILHVWSGGCMYMHAPDVYACTHTHYSHRHQQGRGFAHARPNKVQCDVISSKQFDID